MKLYVGNLAYSTKQAELESAFGAYGEVVSAVVITDKQTGRSKGFGFIEFKEAASGQAAIEGLNGKEVNGRNLSVSEARPKEENPARSNNRR